MRVLSVASEVFPLIKTGGLADVAGALPPALARRGVEMRTVIPGYPQVMARFKKPKPVATLANVLGHSIDILDITIDGLKLFIVDAPALFDREGGPYSDKTGTDHPDNWLRFAAFSKVAARIALGDVPGYKADVVHAHDWQAAPTLTYMLYAQEVAPPSVMTVHNIAFQGQFGPEVFSGLQLPPHAWSMEGIEYYGDVGFLKSGLQAASAITTVSPTYAQEIRTPEFGMGLEGLINARADVVHGIVNGIDADIWNPETDPHIESQFSLRNFKGRQGNRSAMAKRFGLDDDDAPIITLVSRLTWQKGIDVLVVAIDGLVASGVKLAILGNGDKALEGQMLTAAARHPGRVGVIIGYDEPLSHLVQAGADAILIPSRFEPCGLTQLYGLRYGCVPIVARTGGLADTVIDANMAALAVEVATGFHVTPLTADAIVDAVSRMNRLFKEPKTWTKIQRNGMKSDVSWDASATRYHDLYSSLLPAT
jgi:starch synthase